MIQRSDRRQTVALAIESGGLVVTAPARATVERLEQLVRGKALWVTQQLQAARTVPAASARELVSGASLRYLGRQVRLQVVPGAQHLEARMERGWLVVAVAGAGEPDVSGQVRLALVRWYRRRAAERLPARVVLWAAKLGIPAPPLLIRGQHRRWGSCSQAGEVRLNWRIVQAPMSLIDYMPDYEARRDRLRELGPCLEW